VIEICSMVKTLLQLMLDVVMQCVFVDVSS
jgi:hypothetical protein